MGRILEHVSRVSAVISSSVRRIMSRAVDSTGTFVPFGSTIDSDHDKEHEMARAFAGIVIASVLGCGSGVVAPPPRSPLPVGTFQLGRSAQDSTFQAVASPVYVGRGCVTFVSRLRFVAPDSVMETRQFVLPPVGPNTIATEVDTGAVTPVSAGIFQLSYSTRVDTAVTQVSNGVVTQLSVTEHFFNTTDCLTNRIVLSYSLQGS